MGKVEGRKWGRWQVEGEGGFTLIENMVAVALLLIGILAIAGGETTALTMNARRAKIQTAISAAQDMLELIRRNGNNAVSYNNFNTSNNAFATTTTVTAEQDFNWWKGRVEGIQPATSTNPEIACGNAKVRGGCGWIAVAVSPNLMGVNVATVNIVWPGQTKTLTLTAPVGS